jgi:hypothetical protein
MKNYCQVNWELPEDLVRILDDMAAIQGTSASEIVISMLSHSIEQSGMPGSGRCSVRTGLHSAGPRPLPLQQP